MMETVSKEPAEKTEQSDTSMVESTENGLVNNSSAKEDHADVHKDMKEHENTLKPIISSSKLNISKVGSPSSGDQDEQRRRSDDNANENGENVESMDSDQLRSKVEELNDTVEEKMENGENLESMDSDQLRSKVEELNNTVEELEEALHQKGTEVNAKNELLKRNAGIMRNMHMRHQQKDKKIQEMTSRLADLERKVEAMEEFEASLVKTMVNPDLKEIVETVKEQRERILELEKRVREKEEEVEQAEALIDEMNDEKEERVTTPAMLRLQKEERVTPAMLRLRGINVTLARGDEVRETTNPASETDSGKDELGRRMENGGGKPPAPLADILKANIGLTVQRPAGESEGGNESDDEGEEDNIALNRGSEEEVRQQTNPTDMADLLRARGVSIQRSASTSTPPSQSLQSSRHAHDREESFQDDENFTDEEEDEDAKKRPYNFIEEEKERRREKRMREFEEEVKSDAFWSSLPGEKRGEEGEQDNDEWGDEDDDDNDLGSGGMRTWENGGLMIREWEEDGRRVIQWEFEGWREECTDCLRGWVHLCPDDTTFPN